MMHSSLLLLASALTTTSALPAMHPPSWLSLGTPNANLIEIMAILNNHIPQINNIAATSCPHLTNITMDAGTLPPVSPGLTLHHIAVGHGTQNYSCPTSDPAAVPFQLGALATLYNLTCMTAILPQVASTYPTRLAAEPVPDPSQSTYPNPPGSPFMLTQAATPISGHHYFTSNNKTATFNLHTGTTDYGITFSNKIASMNAPNNATSTSADGSVAVPWLKLSVVDPAAQSPPLALEAGPDADSGVKEIYRLNTVGGGPPKDCSKHVGEVEFSQEYAAEYWFWSGS